MGAPSYSLTTSVLTSPAEALDYFSAKLGPTRRYNDPKHPEYIANDEIRVIAYIEQAQDQPDLAAYLGLDEMLVISFYERKGLSAAVSARSLSRMFQVTAEFLEAHPGPLAIFDSDTDDQLLLRRLENGEVEIDRSLLDPEDFNYSGAFDELGRRYPVADLGLLDL